MTSKTERIAGGAGGDTNPVEAKDAVDAAFDDWFERNSLELNKAWMDGALKDMGRREAFKAGIAWAATQDKSEIPTNPQQPDELIAVSRAAAEVIDGYLRADSSPDIAIVRDVLDRLQSAIRATAQPPEAGLAREDNPWRKTADEKPMVGVEIEGRYGTASSFCKAAEDGMWLDQMGYRINPWQEWRYVQAAPSPPAQDVIEQPPIEGELTIEQAVEVLNEQRFRNVTDWSITSYCGSENYVASSRHGGTLFAKAAIAIAEKYLRQAGE